MRQLFEPTSLSSRRFADLVPGVCFYHAPATAWAFICAIPAEAQHLEQKFIVALSGDYRLVAFPFDVDPNYAETRVVAFDVRGTIDIQLESEPTALHRMGANATGSLVILANGPNLYLVAARNVNVPAQRTPFILNLATFACDFAQGHPVGTEVASAPVFSSWSLVLRSTNPADRAVLFQNPVRAPNQGV